MLNRYLERNIQNKLELFTILHSNHLITMKNLLSVFPLSINTINSLIDELNIDFTGLASIQKNASHFSIQIYEETTFMELLHAIYQDSNVLKCLKYMILNDHCCSLAVFTEESYLAKSSAYRLRQNCADYLQQIGLQVRNNKVVGEEYRIRYLIALLHYKYGIECYEMCEQDIDIVRNFVLTTNKSIDRTYLDMTSNEYGYFEYLFFLAWKRKSYLTEPIISKRLQNCKNFFAYDKLIAELKNTLSPILQMDFTKNDMDYFYLIYFTTNNCMFADQWTAENISYLHKLVFDDPEFYDLYLRIAKRLGKQIAASHALKAVLIYFAKKCSLELQCIIPDKNFYLDSKKSHLTQSVIKMLEEILADWNHANHRLYEIDSDHMFYLALQIEQIIKKNMSPIPVFILSELTSELEVISKYINKFFSSRRIELKLFFLGADKKDKICSQKRAIIIVNKKFRYLMEAWKLSEYNTVIPISIELNTQELMTIHRAIEEYEAEIFLDFINQM
ncbi:MAG: helix-turn-helix domain-containing protein [Bacillota bacterium]|nr:helix-turn-helix domain-containing protein [Bacillota bacterium]